MSVCWVRWHDDWHDVLRTSWTLPAVLNFLTCLPIGALLSPDVRGARTALGAGFALSLAVELTQITGTWGLYPCAYRKFDVDDLVLNTLGVVVGFLLAKRLFGVRGGGRAYEESLHEASLLEVEEASQPAVAARDAGAPA